MPRYDFLFCFVFSDCAFHRRRSASIVSHSGDEIEIQRNHPSRCQAQSPNSRYRIGEYDCECLFVGTDDDFCSLRFPFDRSAALCCGHSSPLLPAVAAPDSHCSSRSKLIQSPNIVLSIVGDCRPHRFWPKVFRLFLYYVSQSPRHAHTHTAGRVKTISLSHSFCCPLG